MHVHCGNPKVRWSLTVAPHPGSPEFCQVCWDVAQCLSVCVFFDLVTTLRLSETSGNTEAGISHVSSCWF